MNYSISDFKERKTLKNTVEYSGIILENDTPIIRFHNQGNGGCNSYYPIEPYTMRKVIEFKMDIAKWLKSCELEPIEPEDFWILWETIARKDNILPSEFYKSLFLDTEF